MIELDAKSMTFETMIILMQDHTKILATIKNLALFYPISIGEVWEMNGDEFLVDRIRHTLLFKEGYCLRYIYVRKLINKE